MALDPAVTDDDVAHHLAGVDIDETETYEEFLRVLVAKRATEAAD